MSNGTKVPQSNAGTTTLNPFGPLARVLPAIGSMATTLDIVFPAIVVLTELVSAAVKVVGVGGSVTDRPLGPDLMALPAIGSNVTSAEMLVPTTVTLAVVVVNPTRLEVAGDCQVAVLTPVEVRTRFGAGGQGYSQSGTSLSIGPIIHSAPLN